MLIDYIPVGKENAVSRHYLATTTGFSDRFVRKEIENLRQAGVVICSAFDYKEKGYYLPANEEEKNEFLRKYVAYPKSMIKTYYAMKEGNKDVVL